MVGRGTSFPFVFAGTQSRSSETDSQPLSSLQAQYALQSRGPRVRAGKVLEMLQGIGQPNTSLLDLEEWTAAHEELSKQARLEMQLIATHVNYQFPGHEERQLLNLTTPNNLNFDKLAEEHNIVFLHGRPPKPADLVDGGTASGPLQFPEKTVTSFQNMWKSCAHGRPCIFAVVEDAACADDFFLQLKVSKPAVLKANLQQKSRTWKEGRITLDPEQKPKLLQLCLQCNERSPEELGRREELDMSSTLADLLSHNDKDAVTRAFHAHDLGEDGPSNTEARIWVATLAVAARAVPEVTDATNDSLDSVNVQQCDDDSAQYQLPTVSASQSAVANEIILRILLSKGFITMNEPDNYKKGLERLRARYKDGLDFIVLTPVFVTLRQQTLQRLRDAGLRNSDGSDPKVLPYAFSAEFTRVFEEFRAKVMHDDNKQKLFVMIVDEAHHAAVRRGAHDAYVNDLKWRAGKAEPKHGAWQSKAASPKIEVPGDWSDQKNLITLLVSATPANVMTADSRIPRQYYVPKGLPRQQLQQYSVIKPKDGASENARLAITQWECGHRAVGVDHLQSLIKDKVVRELHVIDWSDAEVVKVPYRSIRDYIASSTKPCAVHRGISSDDLFDQKVQVIRKLVKDVSLDILLAMDYVISMQYFRVFRWDGCLLGVDESKQILQSQPAALQQFHEGLSLVFGGAYKDLQQQYSLPDWPTAYNEKLEEWGAFSTGALKVWLHCKLGAEYHSRGVGQHSNERDRQFTETDRLIKSLLETKLYSPAENADAVDLPGSSNARPATPDIRCAVKGPMIVIRSRPDGMGEKVVYILKQYMQHTQTQDKQWQQRHGQTVTPWQMFEVIGDFGESDQTEVLAKLSAWAKARPMSPDHPERNAKAFMAYWQSGNRVPSLKCYIDFVRAKEKSAAALDGSQRPRKPAGLQYSDLYGVPTILVLCEKGRMGDTFPHTFTCQDQRLRSGSKFSTLVQELGRLCRYPAVCAKVHDLDEPATRTADPVADEEAQRLHLLKQSLQAAYGWDTWRGPPEDEWTNMVHLIAAAASESITSLICFLNGTAAQAKLAKPQPSGMQLLAAFSNAQQYTSVTALPGCNATRPEIPASLHSILQGLRRTLSADPARPHECLLEVIQAIKDWKDNVLSSCDGSGCVLGSAGMPSFKQGLPVRIMLNGSFEKDCLDSNDLVELFCCCPKGSPLLQPRATISLIRHKHHLPYALMMRNVAEQLQKVQHATVLKQEGAAGRALGKAVHSLSEDVMENWPTGGMMDKFMSYTNRGLRGTAVHEYREAASAHNKHYDTGHKHEGHVHPGRFLLKAQPQQGKTGAYIGLLQHLSTILQPVDPWQPVPGQPKLLPISLPVDKWWNPLEGAIVRWQNSCFRDLTGVWRPYENLQPGKYADRVAMQRLVMLASALVERLQQHKSQCPLSVSVDSGSTGQAELRLHIVAPKDVLKQAINWDCRIEAAAAAVVQGEFNEGAFGCDIRFVRGQDGVQIIIKDVACIQAIRRLHTAGSSGFNLVQRSLWPQTPFAHTSAEATEDVPDSADEPGAWSSNSMHASSHLQPAGSMAYSMRVGRILRPVPAAAAIDMQELEPREPVLPLTLKERQALFPVKQSGSLLPTHGPVFLATPAVWWQLQQRSHRSLVQLHAASSSSSFRLKEVSASTEPLPAASIHHWVFVPSYNRYADSDPRQMRIDWADAVSQDTQYVRVVVVRSEAEQVMGYSKLVHEHQLQVEKHLHEASQITLLMVMPHTINLGALPSSFADLREYQRQQQTEAMGIGYSRLATQLIARLMGLSSIWMLDDNISDCWRLPFEEFVRSEGKQHAQLESVKFSTVMATIECQALGASAESRRFGASQVVTERLRGQHVADVVKGTSCNHAPGHMQKGPRSAKQVKDAAQVSRFVEVDSMDKLTGAYSRYGIIGVSLNINGAFKVGFQGQGNPGPWTVGPSVYSMMLINVASTVKEGALYPAKAYHEDVDFAHLCNERQLVVVKCNWLYFHKARLSPDYIKRHVTPGSRSPGSALTLLDPMDHQIRSGQIIRIRAPSNLGAPVHMAIGQNRAAGLRTAGVRKEASSVADGTSTYAVCVTLLPHAHDNASGCMSIRFGQTKSQQLMTSTVVTLHGLFDWQDADTYAAPYELPRAHQFSEMGRVSEDMQLELIMYAIRRASREIKSSPAKRHAGSVGAQSPQQQEGVQETGPAATTDVTRPAQGMGAHAAHSTQQSGARQDSPKDNAAKRQKQEAMSRKDIVKALEDSQEPECKQFQDDIAKSSRDADTMVSQAIEYDKKNQQLMESRRQGKNNMYSARAAAPPASVEER
ncbi:hypothetical protein WJX82_003437 [Trebouxia sp. C0006]